MILIGTIKSITNTRTQKHTHRHTRTHAHGTHYRIQRTYNRILYQSSLHIRSELCSFSWFSPATALTALIGLLKMLETDALSLLH